MKITKERTLTGDTASGLIGVVQRAVVLNEERFASSNCMFAVTILTLTSPGNRCSMTWMDWPPSSLEAIWMRDAKPSTPKQSVGKSCAILISSP